MEPGSGDPGQLPGSLAEGLERSREQCEVYDRGLLQRNRELAAVAAIAESISAGEMDLAAMLERALQVVLDVTGLPAGWILLLSEEDGRVVTVRSSGLSQDSAAAVARFRAADCECRQALDSGAPLVVHPLHPGCLVRGLDLGEGRSPTCHATVPLVAHGRVLGMLNLAGDRPGVFDEQELVLLGSIGRQLGVAVENARLWAELKRRDALRSQMLEQALTAQEDERRRIARELHDQIGQALTSILVWLQALECEANDPAGLTMSPRQLQEFKEIVVDTLDGVHSLATELRPSVLDDLGLVPALRRYVQTYHEHYRLAIDFQTVGLEGVRLSPAVETALYRIVQEALTNVVQHAGAECVSLLLETRRAEPRSVVAIVEDDGCGFEVGPLGRGEMDESWLGLSGMRERAQLVGGRLTIESAPDMGTTVYVEVPLE